MTVQSGPSLTCFLRRCSLCPSSFIFVICIVLAGFTSVVSQRVYIAQVIHVLQLSILLMGQLTNTLATCLESLGALQRKNDLVVDEDRTQLLLICFPTHQGSASSQAQTCQPNQPRFNVTLSAGVASGNFWNLGRVRDVVRCGQLCCQHHKCNLAFSVDDFCYNVECYTEDLCGLRKENFTRHKVAVTMVTRPSVNTLHALNTGLASNNNQTTAGGILSKTTLFPTPGHRELFVEGKNDSKKTVLESADFRTDRNEYGDRLAMDLQPTWLNSHRNDDSGIRFAVHSSFPKKASVRLESKLIQGKKISGTSCKPRGILHRVTLRSGLKSGDFSDFGEVPDMDACVKHCCEQPNCEVSLLLNHHCYTLHCYNPSLCKIIPAPASEFEPQLAFVTRSAKEEKPTTRVKKKTPSSADSCPHGAIFSDVTLKGGHKAGKFELLARGGDMESCIKKCCEKGNCQVAWLLDHYCYSVTCNDKCITVKKHSDKLRSQLTLLSPQPQENGNDKRQNIPGSKGDADKVYTVFLNVTSQVFTDPLKDFESLEFLNLAEKIQVAVSSVFSNVPAYKGAEIISFYPAPVIAKISITVSADTRASTVLRPLVEAVKAGKISSSIDGNPISYDVSGVGFQFLTPNGISLTCASEHDYDIGWTMAIFNSTDSQICPRGAQGQVNRYCAGSEWVNASWNIPDFSECVSSAYRDIHQQTKGLAEKAATKRPYSQVTVNEIITRIERLVFTDTYREELLKEAQTYQDKKISGAKKSKVIKTSKKQHVIKKGKTQFSNDRKVGSKGKPNDDSTSVPVTEIPRLKPEILPTTSAKGSKDHDLFWSSNLKTKTVNGKETNKPIHQSINRPTAVVPVAHIPSETTTGRRTFGKALSATSKTTLQNNGDPVAHRNTIPYQGLRTTSLRRNAWTQRTFQNSAQNVRNFANSNLPSLRQNVVSTNGVRYGNTAPAINTFQRTQIPYQANPQLSPAYAQPRWPGNPGWVGSRGSVQGGWGRAYSPPSYSSDQLDIGKRRKRDVDMLSNRQRRQGAAWYNNNQYLQQLGYYGNQGSEPRTSFQQTGNAFLQNNANSYQNLQNQVAENPYQTNYQLPNLYGKSPGMGTYSTTTQRVQNVAAPGFNTQNRNYAIQPGVVSGGRPVAVERWPKPTHRLQRPTLDFSKNWPSTPSSISHTKVAGGLTPKPLQNVRTTYKNTVRVSIPKPSVKLKPSVKAPPSHNTGQKKVGPLNKSTGSKEKGAQKNLLKELQDLTTSTSHKRIQVMGHKRQNTTVPQENSKPLEKHLAPMFGGDMLLSVGVLQLIQTFARLTDMEFSKTIVQHFVNASSHLLDLKNKQEWSHAQKRAELLFQKGVDILESNSNWEWDESQQVASQDATVRSAVLELVRTVQDLAMNASYSVPFDKPLLTTNILLAVKTFGSDLADPTQPMSLPNYSDPLVANWSSGHDSIILTPTIFDSAVLGNSVKVHLLSCRFKTVSQLVPDTTGNNSGLVLNSAVISSTAQPAVAEELVPPIKIVLSVLNASLNRFEQECVAWTRKEGQGKWSSEGCRLSQSNDTHTTCECKHMTDFAVLANTNKDKIPEVPHPSAAVPSAGPAKDRSWIGVLLGILAVLILIIIVLVLLVVWRKRRKSQDQDQTQRSRSKGPSRRSRSLSRSSSKRSRSGSSKSDGAVSPASSHSSQFEEMIAARRRRMALDKKRKAQRTQEELEDEDEDDLLMKEKAMLFSDYHQPYHFLSKEEQERTEREPQSGDSRSSLPRRGRSAMEQEGSDV